VSSFGSSSAKLDLTEILFVVFCHALELALDLPSFPFRSPITRISQNYPHHISDVFHVWVVSSVGKTIQSRIVSRVFLLVTFSNLKPFQSCQDPTAFSCPRPSFPLPQVALVSSFGPFSLRWILKSRRMLRDVWHHLAGHIGYDSLVAYLLAATASNPCAALYLRTTETRVVVRRLWKRVVLLSLCFVSPSGFRQRRKNKDSE